MYKQSGLVVIAALVISAMGILAPATTPLVAATTPTVTITQTKVRDNGYVLIELTVTNPSGGENIENILLKDVTTGVSSYFTEGVFLNENTYENIDDNVVENMEQFGSELGRVADNLSNARAALVDAADALLRAADFIENAGYDMQSSLVDNVTAAGSALRDADEDLRKAANELKDNYVDFGDVGENLVNTARDISRAGCKLQLVDNEDLEDLEQAGENLDNAGYILENNLAENIKGAKLLWQAGDNLDNIAKALENTSYALQRYSGTGDTLIKNAATYLDNAASELRQAGENLVMAAENIILAAVAIEKIDNEYLDNMVLGSRTSKCGVAQAENIINGGFRDALRKAAGESYDNLPRTKHDNMITLGQGFENAADNQNVWLGVVLASNIIGFENELVTTSARYWFGRAGEALTDNDNINLVEAAGAIDNAAAKFIEAAEKIENTKKNDLTKHVGWGAEYQATNALLLVALNSDNHITAGTTKTFKFLWKAPDIGTLEDHTIRVWTLDKDNDALSSNDFTISVDGEKPSLDIKVTQTGVVDYLGNAVDNVIGQVLDNAKATVTITASEELADLGTIYIDNYEKEGENLQLSMSDFTTTDSIVFTYDFYTTNWKDNAENARVRIAGPCATDLYGLENEVAAYCYFEVDMLQPILLDNGLTQFTNLPWVRKPGTDNDYYVTSVKYWTIKGRAEDNDNMGATGSSDNDLFAMTTVYSNDVALTMVRLADDNWSTSDNLQEGANVLRVRTIDRVGLWVENKLDNIFVDNTIPTVEFISVAGEAWTDNNVVISDNTPTFRLKIQDAGWGIVRPAFIVALSNYDNFDDDPQYGVRENLENNVEWDNGAGTGENAWNFENTWDNTTSTIAGGLVDGYWYIGVTVSDNIAGHDNDNHWMRFKVDTIKPTAPASVTSSVTAGASASARTRTTHTSITMSGTAEASANIIVEVTTDNGVTWAEQTGAATTADTDGNWTTTVTLTEGTIIGIRVKAKDSAGNESTATVLGYLLADTHSPSVTITAPAEGTTTDQASVTITGTLTKDTWESWDDLTLTIQVGTDSVTVPISAGAFTYSVAIGEGTNTIVASVTDGLNTTATASVSVTRTVTPWATYAIIIVIVALILAAIAIFRKR